MKTLLSHRSIRKYQNRPIEKEILDEILKAVQAAPTEKICGVVRWSETYCAGSCFSGVLRRLLPHLAGL